MVIACKALPIALAFIAAVGLLVNYVVVPLFVWLYGLAKEACTFNTLLFGGLGMVGLATWILGYCLVTRKFARDPDFDNV